LQYNVYKRLNIVQIPLLHDEKVKEFDILVIQKPDRFPFAPERHSPPPPDADLRDLANAIYPQGVESARKITKQKVITAVKRLKPNKAPGVFQITNKYL